MDLPEDGAVKVNTSFIGGEAKSLIEALSVEADLFLAEQDSSECLVRMVPEWMDESEDDIGPSKTQLLVMFSFLREDLEAIVHMSFMPDNKRPTTFSDKMFPVIDIIMDDTLKEVEMLVYSGAMVGTVGDDGLITNATKWSGINV